MEKMWISGVMKIGSVKIRIVVSYKFVVWGLVMKLKSG